MGKYTPAHCSNCGQFRGVSAHYCRTVTVPDSRPLDTAFWAKEPPQETVPSIDKIYEAFQDKVRANSLEEELGSGQLPLFLTAPEIREHFQGLDGDRQDWEKDEVYGESQFFERKLMESEYRDLDGEEVDYDEQQQDYEEGLLEYPPERWTLVDDIKINGVLYPVSLQADFFRIGRMGRPEILGGHHRVAVAEQYRPDDFIQVNFYEDVDQARKDLGYQY